MRMKLMKKQAHKENNIEEIQVRGRENERKYKTI